MKNCVKYIVFVLCFALVGPESRADNYFPSDDLLYAPNDWLANVFHRYKYPGLLFEQPSKFIEPLTDDDGIKVKFDLIFWMDQEEGEGVCFYKCPDDMYEAKAGPDTVVCYDCRYQDCENLPFSGYCQPCPELEGSLIPRKILPTKELSSPYDGIYYYDIRACAIPKDVVGTDESGTFFFTENCYYSE